MSAVTLRQLEFLVSLAESGQVTRAALRCNVSQSSMTISLQKLEDQLGAQLFERHAKGVRLTERGEQFARQARSVMMMLEEAIEDVRRSPYDLEGDVRIGVTVSISAYLLPKLQRQFARHFPYLRFQLEECSRETLEAGLIDGRFDVGMLVVSNARPHADLSYETIVRSPRRLWIGFEDPLYSVRTITFSDIAQRAYILLDMDDHLEAMGRYWGERGSRPQIAFKSGSIEAVRSLVAMGQGVTILSDWVYRPVSLEGHRVFRRDLLESLPSMDIGCAWRKSDSLTPTVTSLLHFIRDAI